MAASQVSSQGITHFPNEWARLSAAGEINSGEAKAASTNLVRRQRAHAQAHASLFGELPRPTKLFVEGPEREVDIEPTIFGLLMETDGAVKLVGR